ncbi:hypothetical protein [Sphingobacterium wenxiniae]|uniref:Outer membrane protein beta-barrel domain-containing protein n=1 Tax=Sphingobacterium wenxiniae TaxID=683125 RepID=A0A1I6T2K7_9SPHI|nr:hypothetical protein [Sphingobacterium wenxiniae]SFS83499.1 hypothetical protein SAMN05660206_105229 [Sphingobacterium wenxiniae]
MKKIFIIFLAIFVLIMDLYSQSGFGVDIGGASSKSYLLNLKYFKNKNHFSIGVTRELNDTNGKKVSHQLTNYGREVIGNGEYFSTVDFSFGRFFTKKLSISTEVSLGKTNHYTNYRDNRFNNGGYYMVNSTSSLFGFGGYCTYTLNKAFGLFAGYNSIRKISGGLELRLIN